MVTAVHDEGEETIMNQALMRARTGMGFGPDLLPSPDDPAYWNDPYQDYPRRPTYTTQPTFPSSSPGVIAPQIPTLVALGLRTISNIFAPPQVSVAQAGAQNAALYAQQYGQRYPLTTVPQTSSTIGADSGGLTIFGSRIGWVPILIVAGILFFPGFSRRK
jgi:hypothetical protein